MSLDHVEDYVPSPVLWTHLINNLHEILRSRKRPWLFHFRNKVTNSPRVATWSHSELMMESVIQLRSPDIDPASSCAREGQEAPPPSLSLPFLPLCTEQVACEDKRCHLGFALEFYTKTVHFRGGLLV